MIKKSILVKISQIKLVRILKSPKNIRLYIISLIFRRFKFMVIISFGNDFFNRFEEKTTVNL